MKRPLILFMSVLAAYVLTGGGHLFSPDEEVLFRTTRALANEGTLAIKPYDPTGFGTRKPSTKRSDGREYGQYGIGQPLLAVPLVWLGQALANVGSAESWNRLYSATVNLYPDTPTSASSPAEIAPRWVCSWFNIVLGALMAALLYLVCLELTGHAPAATWAALLYALGSLAWAHSRPFFTESCAAFFILLAWYGLLRARRAGVIPWCFAAGAAAGYAALVRMDSLFAYPALAILLLGPIVEAARRQGRRVIVVWAAFCLPALLCGAVLLILNKLHFGSPFSTGYTDQPEGVAFSTPIQAGLYGFLFSIGKGLFFFSPALALSFLGWRHLKGERGERHPALIWAIGAAVAVPLAVHATWQNWAGGWCWGPRHIFLIHPFLALPVAAWFAATWGRASRAIAVLALLVGAAVQIFGSSQNFITYHIKFFRSPAGGSGTATDLMHRYVFYDPLDRQYWEQYYQMYFRVSPGAPPQRVSLYPPRPIQDTLYIPQASIWAGYRQMLHEGHLDNFWVRLLHAVRSPAAVLPPAKAPKP